MSKEELEGWNDKVGAGLVYSLTILMENLGTLDEETEDIAYNALIDFWHLEFIYPKI